MLNEKFWLAISFTSFVILMIKFVKPIILKSLDTKSQEIAEEIDTAKKMKEQAAELLVQAEKYHNESKKFADKLISDADLEAQKFATDAKQSAEDEVAKKTAASIERIKIEEVIAIREIKTKIVSSTIESISNNIGSEMNNEQHNHLVAKSVQDLGKA